MKKWLKRILEWIVVIALVLFVVAVMALYTFCLIERVSKGAGS